MNFREFRLALSRALRDPRVLRAGPVAVSLLVLLSVWAGNDLRVTGAKGCEIAAWARNVAERVGFNPGAHWLGEAVDGGSLEEPSGHYPPLPAVLHSLPLLIFGEGVPQVLLLSLIAFLVLPLWIATLERGTGLTRPTLVGAALVLALFPPLVSAAFQPDGEILLALLGASALACLFQSRTPSEALPAGLIGGAALTVSLDAWALFPASVLYAAARTKGAPRAFASWTARLLAGWLPGTAALVGFGIASRPEGNPWYAGLRILPTLETDPVLGYPRALAAPGTWSPPDHPGGTVGLLLDGLARHSEAALASAPFWCWGVLVIGVLMGRPTLRERTLLVLLTWTCVWFSRGFRFAEKTEAFLLVSVWLVLLSVETLFAVLEVLVRLSRVSPAARTALLGGVLLATWWPGFYTIRDLRREMDPDRTTLEDLWAERILAATGPENLILTDTPQRLAWITGRNTAWLPATPALLSRVADAGKETVVVLSGAIASAPDVDPAWWESFEAGTGAGEFTEVLLDEETYCQVWRKPEW